MSTNGGNGKLDSDQTLWEVTNALEELEEQIRNYASLRKIAQFLEEKYHLLHEKIEAYQRNIAGQIQAFEEIYRTHYDSLERNGSLQQELKSELADYRRETEEQLREFAGVIEDLLRQIHSHEKVVEQVVEAIPPDLSQRLQKVVENLEGQMDSLPRLGEYLNQLPFQDALELLKSLQDFYADNREFHELIRSEMLRFKNLMSGQEELRRKLSQLHQPLEKLIVTIRKSDERFKYISKDLGDSFLKLKETVYNSAANVAGLEKEIQAILVSQSHLRAEVDDTLAHISTKISDLAIEQKALRGDVKKLLMIVKPIKLLSMINLILWGMLGLYLFLR